MPDSKRSKNQIVLLIKPTGFVPVTSSSPRSIWPPSTPGEPAALKIFIEVVCFHCVFWRQEALLGTGPSTK